MNVVVARLAALAASIVVALLAVRQVEGITPEVAAMIERWLEITFELLLLAAYAVLRAWLQRYANGLGQPPQCGSAVRGGAGTPRRRHTEVAR
jgi:hypothetical protein